MKLTCLHPILIFRDKEHHSDAIQVPCGKCVACVRKRNLDWCTRCVFESRTYGEDNCCFVTLTYDDVHLPNCGLYKRHTQLFLKRLRSTLYPQKIRFYLCGEYGSRTHRPHYHAIIFGIGKDVMDSLPSTLWPYGNICVGYANEKSIAYTCGYCNKSFSWPKGKTPVFRLMSRRPGLGLDYFDNNRDEILRLYSVLPRYLDDKLFPKGSDQQLLHKLFRTRLLAQQFIADKALAESQGKNVYKFRRELNWQRERDFEAFLSLRGGVL